MRTFMIRESAMMSGHYYIDFDGDYEIADISRVTGITMDTIHQVYENNGGIYNPERKVYYFVQYGEAAEAVNTLRHSLKPTRIGRPMLLSEEEIDYIRKALLNDGDDSFESRRIKGSIFDKFNQ